MKESDAIPNEDDWVARREQERAARNDAAWWEDDYAIGADAELLTKALETLRDACHCQPGKLLSDLREIELLSGGYRFTIDRKELPALVRRLNVLAKEVERLQMSPLHYELPPDAQELPAMLSTFADAVEKARSNTRHNDRPKRLRRIQQLLRYVDDRVREYGDVGKVQADRALATLLSAVTSTQWNGTALRMQRSRINKKQGRNTLPKDKRKIARRVRGSRAKDRRSRFVPFHEFMAAENRDDDGGDDIESRLSKLFDAPESEEGE